MSAKAEVIIDLLNNFEQQTCYEQLKTLFWKELNYNRSNEPLSTREWTDKAKELIINEPVLFASGGINDGFHIIYCRLKAARLHITAERTIINKLLVNHPYSMFIFSNADQTLWHLVNVKYCEDTAKRKLFRRISIGPNEKYRTASERISMLDAEPGEELFTDFLIQNKHDEAFDVEKVTEKFFEDYKALFDEIKTYLHNQSQEKSWAHDFTLQFLNRIMFIYFIQRKGWMGEDADFLHNFWMGYKKSDHAENTFYSKWLSILLFQTFNGKKYDERSRHFPDDIKSILNLAPYLNGGLFTENKLDEIGKTQNIKIEDKCFKTIFEFFNSYNFTISEDSPFDQEVAVDPEMIGKVYESLVNVSEEIDERGEAGIFYTPRIEIDLMCKLSLVAFLTNHLGSEHKPLLYEFIMAFDAEEKEQADAQITEKTLWQTIESLLRDLTVVDPACGSGSFPVGMLQILDDLFIRIDAALNRHSESSYDRKKRIIGNSLYGVDVMKWAVDVAELRLWLQLIIDTEIPLSQRQLFPLLPNLDFKIRQGDSLVQEIGGIDFGHYKKYTTVDTRIKKLITEFKKAKYDYYQNVDNQKYRSEDQVKQQERNIFLEILKCQKLQKQKEIDKLNDEKADKKSVQVQSFDFAGGDDPVQADWADDKIDGKISAIRKEIELIEADIDELKKNEKNMPFVWDISFVEIFSGDNHGFDIVIGNPPYVRQEKIADPLKDPANYGGEDTAAWKQQKQKYKAKLMRSVYLEFPKYFHYKEQEDSSAIQLNAKSDLYIYFYFHGLRLLNEKGSFCFITSNSWLDVGYGKDLQEFLLKHSQVKFIIDNQVKRSFKSASVNTIIALFSRPDEKNLIGFNHIARFVMFKTEFENTLSSVLWEEIEEAADRTPTPEYKVFPINQKELWQDGLEHPESKDKLADNPYIGNKWGGKYLRAPEIYWTILKKGKDKLVRLGDIAEVRFGIKTGANEFFYLTKEKIEEWGIEEEFLKPVIKSLKGSKSIMINPNELKSKVLMIDYKANIEHKSVKKYIDWGKENNFHLRPTCKSRIKWYSLNNLEKSDMMISMMYGDRFIILKNKGVLDDHNLFGIILHNKELLDPVLLSLNSTLTRLFYEVTAYTLTGSITVAKMDGWQLKKLLFAKIGNGYKNLIIDILKLNLNREIKSLFEECGFNKEIPIREQEPNPLPDRKALDDVVFDVLGLTAEERKEVYWAVCELVQNRLNKAKSV
ncbi:MAG: Eco57I restriction-modification methylase domain-containing protein [Candidatus Cloacimonadales bacterium]|nr:Eco57I restriction-modification methylase domain-containing protein [Candidatus Cloacimonadales bacterium]